MHTYTMLILGYSYLDIIMKSKQLVKYQTFDGEVVEAPITLVVKREKNKSNRCKCHHCRIGESGVCNYGRCRHESVHHTAVVGKLF
jgi:hypothetical protein